MIPKVNNLPQARCHGGSHLEWSCDLGDDSMRSCDQLTKEQLDPKLGRKVKGEKQVISMN